LQLLGYYKGPIDGDVGQGTRTALRNFFQHQADLASKGTVSNAAIGLFGTEPSQIQTVSGSDKR
jgi:peptidoglycan hydrolase-like protein with peptidoglycan-binding domain